MPPRSTSSPDRRGGWHARLEPAAWFGVAALAVYLVSISWLKWPDPQTGFGSQLCIPWRLSQGAILYHDANHFYGPISHYVNAALFVSIFAYSQCAGTGNYNGVTP